MPGGYKKITGKDGNTFSADNQPENRGRKPGVRAWKDVLSDMMPEDGYLTFEKAQVVDENGQPTGEIIPRVRVKMATQEMIVMAAIKQAMKGKMDAIRTIWERMDGKPAQPIEGTNNPIVFQVAQAATKNDIESDTIE